MTHTRLFFCLLLLAVSGCVTKPQPHSDLTLETEEQKSHRRVFEDDWLRPSVTKEDYDFFYKGFFWGGR